MSEKRQIPPHMESFQRGQHHVREASAVNVSRRLFREARRTVGIGVLGTAGTALAVTAEVVLASKGIHVGNLTTTAGEAATGIVAESTTLAATGVYFLQAFIHEGIRFVGHVINAGKHHVDAAGHVLNDPQGAIDYHAGELGVHAEPFRRFFGRLQPEEKKGEE